MFNRLSKSQDKYITKTWIVNFTFVFRFWIAWCPTQYKLPSDCKKKAAMIRTRGMKVSLTHLFIFRYNFQFQINHFHKVRAGKVFGRIKSDQQTNMPLAKFLKSLRHWTSHWHERTAIFLFVFRVDNSTISVKLFFRIKSPIAIELEFLFLSCSLPSVISTSSILLVLNGELVSLLAKSNSFCRMLFAASNVAVPTLAVVHEPPCEGARGNFESPSSNFTFSADKPKCSAAIIVMTV